MHILAGVPSTQTLLDIAQVPLSDPRSSTPTCVNPLQRRTFSSSDGLESHGSEAQHLPNENGLERVAREARACGEVNYVGTVLALACFVGSLQTTSRIPILMSSYLCSHPHPNRQSCIICRR